MTFAQGHDIVYQFAQRKSSDDFPFFLSVLELDENESLDEVEEISKCDKGSKRDLYSLLLFNFNDGQSSFSAEIIDHCAEWRCRMRPVLSAETASTTPNCWSIG